MHRQQVPTAPPWPGPIPIFICASFHPFLSTESTHYRPQTNHPKATIARRIILLFLPLFLLQFFTNFQPLSNTNIHYSYLPSTTTLTNSTTILSPPTPTSRIPPSQISTNKSTINTYQFLRKINPTKQNFGWKFHPKQIDSLPKQQRTITHYTMTEHTTMSPTPSPPSPTEIAPHGTPTHAQTSRENALGTTPIPPTQNNACPPNHLDQLNSLISSNSTIAELNAALIKWITTANDMTGLNDDHP